MNKRVLQDFLLALTIIVLGYTLIACNSGPAASPTRMAVAPPAMPTNPQPAPVATRIAPTSTRIAVVRAATPTIPQSAPISTRVAPAPTAVNVRPTSARSTAASVPNMDRLSYQELLNLIGKSLDDPEFRDYAMANAAACVFQGLYYTCKSKGIQMSRNTGGKVVTIFLFAQGADGFKEYQGELPHGLTWQDTRATVERKIGKPNDGLVVLEKYEATYKQLGLVIAYRTSSTTDLSARLYYIQVQPSIR